MGRRPDEEGSMPEFLLNNARSRKADLVKRGTRIEAEIERVDDEIRKSQCLMDRRAKYGR